MTQTTNTTTTDKADTTGAVSASTLEHLDPASLVIDANVRTDPRLDPRFVASVKERGVLEPVVAYRDAHGQDHEADRGACDGRQGDPTGQASDDHVRAAR